MSCRLRRRGPGRKLGVSEPAAGQPSDSPGWSGHTPWRGQMPNLRIKGGNLTVPHRSREKNFFPRFLRAQSWNLRFSPPHTLTPKAPEEQPPPMRDPKKKIFFPGLWGGWSLDPRDTEIWPCGPHRHSSPARRCSVSAALDPSWRGSEQACCKNTHSPFAQTPRPIQSTIQCSL